MNIFPSHSENDCLPTKSVYLQVLDKVLTHCSDKYNDYLPTLRKALSMNAIIEYLQALCPAIVIHQPGYSGFMESAAALMLKYASIQALEDNIESLEVFDSVALNLLGSESYEVRLKTLEFAEVFPNRKWFKLSKNVPTLKFFSAIVSLAFNPSENPLCIAKVVVQSSASVYRGLYANYGLFNIMTYICIRLSDRL